MGFQCHIANIVLLTQFVRAVDVHPLRKAAVVTIMMPGVTMMVTMSNTACLAASYNEDGPQSLCRADGAAEPEGEQPRKFVQAQSKQTRSCVQV